MQIPWQEFNIDPNWVKAQNENYQDSMAKAATACVFSEFMTDPQANWHTRTYRSRDGEPRQMLDHAIFIQCLEELKNVPVFGRLSIVLLALEKAFLMMSVHKDQEGQKMLNLLDREIRVVLKIIETAQEASNSRIH